MTGLADDARWRHELDSLIELTDPTPAQKRRIAELYELFGDNETAYVWWGYAAASGDRDAIDMLELLTEQRQLRGSNDNDKEK